MEFSAYWDSSTSAAAQQYSPAGYGWFAVGLLLGWSGLRTLIYRYPTQRIRSESYSTVFNMLHCYSSPTVSRRADIHQ